MWIPPQTTVPPLATARSAAGTSSPAGEDERGVELLGRRAERVAGPLRAELQGEGLGRLVVGAREREHAPALVDRHLADDVRRRAEAVDARGARRRRRAAGPVADQPGAQERRAWKVLVALGEREAEALVGHRALGVAAVEVVAGEAGAVAEVLAAERQ